MLEKLKNRSRNKVQIITHHGEIQHSFLSPEFVDYPRGTGWYVVAAAVSIGIIALGVLLQAITMTLAFVVFVAVYWLLHQRKARLIDAAITQNGVRYGVEFFPYDNIREFWIIQNPPFASDLRLRLDRRFYPIITIHIFGQDPAVIRQLLAPHLVEVEREEGFNDLLARALRL